MDIEKEAEEIIDDIDQRGDAKRCSTDQWIDFLEILCCAMETRYEAAKEDRKRREGAL